MDGPTRAVILGIVLTAVMALVGYLLKKTIEDIGGDIKSIRLGAEEYAERQSNREARWEARVNRIETWRVLVDDRHHREDRERDRGHHGDSQES